MKKEKWRRRREEDMERGTGSHTNIRIAGRKTKAAADCRLRRVGDRSSHDGDREKEEERKKEREGEREQKELEEKEDEREDDRRRKKEKKKNKKTRKGKRR